MGNEQTRHNYIQWVNGYWRPLYKDSSQLFRVHHSQRDIFGNDDVLGQGILEIPISPGMVLGLGEARG